MAIHQIITHVGHLIQFLPCIGIKMNTWEIVAQSMLENFQWKSAHHPYVQLVPGPFLQLKIHYSVSCITDWEKNSISLFSMWQCDALSKFYVPNSGSIQNVLNSKINWSGNFKLCKKYPVEHLIEVLCGFLSFKRLKLYFPSLHLLKAPSSFTLSLQGFSF